MKGQSLIIQFLLFFLIGFTIFISITNWFDLRKSLFQTTLATAIRKNLANHIFFLGEEVSLSSSDICIINTSVPEQASGFYHTFSFENNKYLNVESVGIKKVYKKGLMNLNYSFVFENKNREVPSVEKIRLIKSKNKISISGIS
ncbi:MAG: hypothetical protein J7L39_04140 [Candidatus Aenigmarchaeota archaeon]|nr:hypothetical protein [Candidatus Aenigmarchaeota archaeon]